MPRADHVVLVFIDGLRPDAVTPEHAPGLHAMQVGGVHSPGARTVLPSITLPAHTSHLTGLTPEEHGVTWNTWEPERGRVGAETVLDLARAAGLRTGLVAGKWKLRHLADREEVDCWEIDNLDDAEVMERALACLSEVVPHLLVVHLPQVDLVGHESGWMSAEQLDRIRRTDGLVSRLVEAIEARPPDETWVVLVSADHGGKGKNHGAGRPIDLGIPWIVWGDGVEPAVIPPVSATDTAATVLRILGITSTPG